MLQVIQQISKTVQQRCGFSYVGGLKHILKEKIRDIMVDRKRKSASAPAEKQDVSMPAPPFPFKKVKSNIALVESPFPEFVRPSPAEALLVVDLLTDLHGFPTRGEHVMPVLDAIVRTILSQNTTDKLSHKAFVNLKLHFPTWRQVHDEFGTGRVEAAIREGGLSEMKAKNIHNILAYLLHVHGPNCVDGEPSYEWLREESTAFCKAELAKHNGIGPKTISCVLLFNLSRPEFPVDTHVSHISKTMKWVPASATAELTYAHMNARVPDEAKYALHVLLVEHGKRCPRCAKGGRLQLPQEGECPLLRLEEKLNDKGGTKILSLSSSSSSSGSSKRKPMVRESGCDVFSLELGVGGPITTESLVKTKTQIKIKIEEEALNVAEHLSSPAKRVKMIKEGNVKIKLEQDNDMYPTNSSNKKNVQRRKLMHLDMQG